MDETTGREPTGRDPTSRKARAPGTTRRGSAYVDAGPQDATHRIALDPAAIAAAAAATSGTGALGEALAARHLVVDDGLRIVARNWRLAAGELRGELDLIALDEAAGRLVVCEVKTRRDAQRFGGAIAAVGTRKRGKVRALTGAFLREATLQVHQVRLDVVAVDLGLRASLTHVQAAL